MENTEYLHSINQSQRLRRIAQQLFDLNQELLEVARTYAQMTGHQLPTTIQEAMILAENVKKEILNDCAEGTGGVSLS